MNGVTPGPWTVTPVCIGPEVSAMIHTPEGYIAEFMYGDFQANAQFVCDARELFDRAQNVILTFDGAEFLKTEFSPEAIEPLREIVAKMAKGVNP